MEPTTHNLEITNDALACRMFGNRENTTNSAMRTQWRQQRGRRFGTRKRKHWASTRISHVWRE